MRHGSAPKGAPRITAAKWDRDDCSRGIDEARDRVHALQTVVEHAIVFGEPLDELGDHIVIMLAAIDRYLDIAAVAA